MANGFMDFLTGGGAYADPNQVDPNTGAPYGAVRQAFFNQLGNVGAALMAAGQPVEAAVRAQLLAQAGGFGSGMQRDIFNASQSRLMQSQVQTAEQERQRLRALGERINDPAFLKELNLTKEQAMALGPKGIADVLEKKATQDPMDRTIKLLNAQKLGLEIAGQQQLLNFDANLGTLGTTPATPGAAPGLPEGAGATNVNQSLTPQEINYIKSLPAGEARRTAYMQLMQQKLTKPGVEEEIPLTEKERNQNNVPAGQPAFKKIKRLPDGKEVVTGYNIPNIQRPDRQMTDKAFDWTLKSTGEMRDAASNSASILRTNESLEDLLDAGIFTGAFGPAKLESARVATALQDFLGIQDKGRLTELVANTQLFDAQMKEKALSLVKNLGPNPSNADRDYADAVIGGKIALNPESIRKIIEISNRAEQRKIEAYNKQAETFLGAINDEQRKLLAPSFSRIEAPKPRRMQTTPGGVNWSY